MKSATQRPLSWVNSLDVGSPPVARECVRQVTPAFSARDPPRWRPISARDNASDPFLQGDRSPISLLSADSPAPESLICDPESHQQRTEKLANSSVPPNHDAEHQHATFEGEPAPKGQETIESLLESSSNLQKNTQDAPDSTRSANLQTVPQDTPDAHPDGEGEGEERSDQTNRYEASLKEATNSVLDSASFVEDERHVTQPLVRDGGEKGNGDDENERIDKDEGNGAEQTEHVEEEAGASSAHRVEGSDDGGPEAHETIYIEPESTQSDEGLQEHARGYRTSNSARLVGGVSDAHDVPSAAELVNVQGTASSSETSAVRISLNDVVSIPRRELEHGMDTGQSILNDLVAVQANAANEQAEQLGLTTHHRDDMEKYQSHQSGEVCDEDEIVVANGPQRGPRSNGGVFDPRTKDTPVPGGHNHGLTNANDSSSDIEEDSDDTDLKGNTSNQVRPRAKRAYGANLSISETPKKRRKTSIHFTEQMTCSAVKHPE
jgi:hypothetical protein